MNANIDYGNLLSKAWQITWKNKWLWLLGFFAGLGSNGSVNFNSRVNTSIGPNGTPELPPQMQQMMDQFRRPEVLGVVLTIGCLFLLIVLALIVLHVISRGGLIGGIRLADDNGQVSLGEAWALGLRYFWRVLGLEILQIVPVLLVVIVLVIAFVILGIATFGLGVLCILPLICILAILAIPYNLVFWLAGFSLILEETGVFDSVKRGWEMFKANLVPVLLVGFMLFILLFIVGLISLIPVAVIILPAMLSFMNDPRNPNLGLLIGSGLALLCLIPIFWVVHAILTTWVYSVWTLLYRKLSGLAPQAPVVPVSQPA